MVGEMGFSPSKLCVGIPTPCNPSDGLSCQPHLLPAASFLRIITFFAQGVFGDNSRSGSSDCDGARPMGGQWFWLWNMKVANCCGYRGCRFVRRDDVRRYAVITTENPSLNARRLLGTSWMDHPPRLRAERIRKSYPLLC